MRVAAARLGTVLLLSLLAACGGGGGDNPPPPTPPSITAQPQSATVNQGQTASFTVTASGTAPLSYQWRKGGTAVAGASTAVLTLASAQPGDAGSYDVLVTNSAGSAASAAATLTVVVPPSIATQPQAQTVLAPAAATFSVTATGTAPLSYQWKRNGADLPGANTASYTTATTGAADHGALFTVAVTNPAGTVTSAPAALTVNVAAAITAQPQPTAVVAPAAATFTVAAVGTAPLSYQWKRNGVNVGANAASYTTPATTGADHGAVYSVVVSNPFGAETSGGAVLTVNLPPSITVAPLPQSVVAPAAATFSVTATGTAPLSYQWKRNGVNLPGATGTSYTTPATTLADHGALYAVEVNSPYGAAVSAGALLTVTSAPVAPAITTPPASQTVTAPAPATFSVVASGTPPLSYQWKRNGVNVGTNAASYTTPATSLADHGAQYSVVVSNAAGSATGGPATLSVNAGPTITANPSNQTVTAPAAATFSVTASGTAPLSYQWRKGGIDIGGANAATYTTPATVTGDSGSSYDVRVSNAFGTVTSTAAVLTVNPPAALDLSIPTVYIVQSTQTPSFNVPLVKDREGLLRAFVVASAANSATPQVRVRVYNAASALLDTYTINAPGGSVPTSVNEGSLANSWNVLLPAAYIQPSYKIQVDVDPTNAIAEGNESNNYWVSSTPQNLDVRSLNPFRVTFWAVQTGDGRVGAVGAGTIADFTSLLEKIWPVPNGTDRAYGGTWTTSVTTLASDGTGWSTCLSELRTKRTADAVTNRYYYGVVNPNYSGGVAGLGYLGLPTAIGWDKTNPGYGDSGIMSGVFAHEVGHNFNLNHAPCGGAGGPDPAYPYGGGLIGAWGTDPAGPALKSPSTYTDIMGYCDTVWVSDYNFKKVLSNRQSGSVPIVVEAVPEARATPRSLLLWGRLSDGEPVLEPAFHMAVDALPPEPGDQLLEGFDAAGRRLFAVPFGLEEVACLPRGDARHFSFSIPLAAEDAGRLAELRWSKAGELLARRGWDSPGAARSVRPGWEPMLQPLADGRTRILWDATAEPMVMVRDRATGQVIGFGRGGELRLGTAADSLELHLSTGTASRALTLRRPRIED